MLKPTLLLLCLSLFSLSFCKLEPAQEASATSDLLIKTAAGVEHKFQVDLALTVQEQMRGLMFRESMPNDAGMLFYFGDSQPRSFWMKNTLIPLDLIFVNAVGKIIHIHHNAIPHDLTPIPSNGNAAGVLEINGGLSVDLEINSGDLVKHPFFKS